MYIVYESNYYGDNCANDIDSAVILGLYRTLDKAMDKANEVINDYITDKGYVLSTGIENGTGKDGGFYRVFYNSQDNWDGFTDIIIERKEVE